MGDRTGKDGSVNTVNYSGLELGAIACDEPTVPTDYSPNVIKEESPDGTLVGSRIRDSNYHVPIFDLDFDCRLIPSRTPGHFHLYFGRIITRSAYRNLLEAFREAGLIQEAWKLNLDGNGQTFLRLPVDPSSLPDWAPKSRYKDPEMDMPAASEAKS